jgi:DNA-binding PadR family transcriptional regulator
MSKQTSLLSPPVFYILLSLSLKERHGYEIMKQVQADSKGRITLGPGTLYGAIKRMLQDGYIIEVDERPDPNMDDTRRRYYKLTELGRKNLSTELQRYAEALEAAQRARALPANVVPTFGKLAF